MRPLVLLRPEPGLSASAARARALGLDVIEAPLFAVAPVAWNVSDPEGFDGLLLTSANAIRHGGTGLEILHNLPVHAVGDATADAARAAGFTVQSVGSGGIEDLLREIPGDRRLLHLAGEDRMEIGDVRRSITSIVVYRSVATEPPALPTSDVVIAVHSPRAGQRLAELVGERSSVRIAAISRAAAAACGDGWESVEAADQPDDSSLLALAARLCQTSPQ